MQVEGRLTTLLAASTVVSPPGAASLMRKIFSVLFFASSLLPTGCGEQEYWVDIPGIRTQSLPPQLLVPLQTTSIAVEVPGGVDVFQLVLSNLKNHQVTPEKILSPTGEIFFDRSKGIARNQVDPGDVELVIQVPNHPSESLIPGSWVLEFSTDGEVSPPLTVIFRTEAPEAIELRVFVHLIGPKWEGAEALPAALESILHESSSILKAGGGPSLVVEGWDVRGDGASEYWKNVSNVGQFDGEEQVIFEGVSVRRRALELFIVDDIQRGGGKGSALSWSGGVPGPALRPGGPRSGILLALGLGGETRDDAPFVEERGQALAHAIAHYLGVRHTTEANGNELYTDLGSETGQDFLDSTSICPDTQDGDEDSFLIWSECADYDGDNVMFWNPVATSLELEPEQGAQMKLHPLVY